MAIGTSENAHEAHLYSIGAQRKYFEAIAQGESRTALLIEGVVYKVGRDSANRWEHECLTEWRKAGAGWAPETALYVGTDGYGDDYTVIAMPYLPDDGGRIDPDTLAAPQTCRENYVSHRGQTYLIDGGDIETSPQR